MSTRRHISRILLPAVALGAMTLGACAAPDGTPLVEDKFPDAISTDGLARLRACESGGNFAPSAAAARPRRLPVHPPDLERHRRTLLPELHGVDPPPRPRPGTRTTGDLLATVPCRPTGRPELAGLLEAGLTHPHGLSAGPASIWPTPTPSVYSSLLQICARSSIE